MFIWDDFQEFYDKKYMMFTINRAYRERSFRSEDEYVAEQRKLADEIDERDRVVEEKLAELVREAFPEVEVIKFDSRMCSAAHLLLGRTLTRGVQSNARTLEVATWIEKKTAHRVLVDRIEDFSEEDAKKILEECAKR